MTKRVRQRWTAMAEISRLPGPVADVWEWQLQGSCRDADPTLFFHPEGERGPARRNRDAAAKAICAGCPVIEQCRQHALAVREPYGVWGCLTEDEREAIYSGDRRRGVPVAS
jgi:WhiB family redox-sensing transcriptional regulator